MKVHEAEMILEYCADIPCRLNIIRRQCAALDDEIDTMRGVNMDGMPRGGEPGDGPATMAVKMDELGIGDRFRVLHQQQEELRADFELIQKEIDSMSGVHNIILTEFYGPRHKREVSDAETCCQQDQQKDGNSGRKPFPPGMAAVLGFVLFVCHPAHLNVM